MASRTNYEVRVAGVIGPAAREAFDDLTIRLEPSATVLAGSLDQAALHGLIAPVAGSAPTPTPATIPAVEGDPLS